MGRHLNACKEEIRLILNGEHSQKTSRSNPALNGSHDGVRLIVYTGPSRITRRHHTGGEGGTRPCILLPQSGYMRQGDSTLCLHGCCRCLQLRKRRPVWRTRAGDVAGEVEDGRMGCGCVLDDPRSHSPCDGRAQVQLAFSRRHSTTKRMGRGLTHLGTCGPVFCFCIVWRGYDKLKQITLTAPEVIFDSRAAREGPWHRERGPAPQDASYTSKVVSWKHVYACFT